MTPKFLDPLIIEAKAPNTWLLTKEFSYLTLALGKPAKITVPAGFENDLASIPRLLTWAFPVNGKHRWAAVVHDWLYHNKGEIEGLKLTRKQCDRIFLEGMQTMGVGRVKRSMMYRGVRTGGWTSW